MAEGAIPGAMLHGHEEGRRADLMRTSLHDDIEQRPEVPRGAGTPFWRIGSAVDDVAAERTPTADGEDPPSRRGVARGPSGHT